MCISRREDHPGRCRGCLQVRAVRSRSTSCSWSWRCCCRTTASTCTCWGRTSHSTCMASPPPSLRLLVAEQHTAPQWQHQLLIVIRMLRLALRVGRVSGGPMDARREAAPSAPARQADIASARAAQAAPAAAAVQLAAEAAAQTAPQAPPQPAHKQQPYTPVRACCGCLIACPRHGALMRGQACGALMRHLATCKQAATRSRSAKGRAVPTSNRRDLVGCGPPDVPVV
jgi:hypothetical protein